MAEGVMLPARPRLLGRGFGALLLANVCFGYAFSSFFLLPKYMAVVLGAGPAQVGYLTAVHGAAVVVLLPCVGAAVDRVGRRRFLLAGALLMACACLAYPAVSTVGALLYGLRMLQAAAFAMVFAAGGALAVDLAAPDRLGQAIGVYGLSFLSMNAVAPAVVEQVALHTGFSSAFALAGAGALACAVLSLRVPEPAPAADGDGADGMLRLLRRPALLLALVVITLVGSAMSAVFNFHQLFAVELGIPRVSVFFVAYAAAAIGVRLGFGPWMDRFGNERAAALALVLYGAVVYSTSHLGSVGLVALGVGLGIAHGVFYPAFNAVVVAGARAGERGRVMAVFQAAFQTGMAGGGLSFGMLAASAGYPAVFETAAAGLAVAFPLALAAATSRGAPMR